jgi:hypothetical protein
MVSNNANGVDAQRTLAQDPADILKSVDKDTRLVGLNQLAAHFDHSAISY